VASKPLFIAAVDWPRLARKLQVEHVLRVDAAGGWQLSKAMQSRIEYVGGRPKALEVLP
jgi:thiamine biosynthesis lipoprotein